MYNKWELDTNFLFHFTAQVVMPVPASKVALLFSQPPRPFSPSFVSLRYCLCSLSIIIHSLNIL
jgi:hypothetical protein